MIEQEEPPRQDAVIRFGYSTMLNKVTVQVIDGVGAESARGFMSKPEVEHLIGLLQEFLPTMSQERILQ